MNEVRLIAYLEQRVAGLQERFPQLAPHERWEELDLWLTLSGLDASEVVERHNWKEEGF